MPVKKPHGLVIVAHPDDEILWCGGWILAHPALHWHIVSLCRRSDADRAPRFMRILDAIGASGIMGDLDDGPEQHPLSSGEIPALLHTLLGTIRNIDLLLTHGPRGEYTRHLRHEECHRGVVDLVRSGDLNPREFRVFAYDDAGGTRCPRPSAEAGQRFTLNGRVWAKKIELLTEIYGFRPDSWEVRCASREEAFNYVEVNE